MVLQNYFLMATDFTQLKNIDKASEPLIGSTIPLCATGLLTFWSQIVKIVSEVFGSYEEGRGSVDLQEEGPLRGA